METFYRVQDAKGIGPYQSDKYDDTMVASHSYWNSKSHPTPMISGRYLPTKRDRCGFRTMKDLYRWFGGWLPGLIHDGYHVVKVEGKLKYEDSYQVVFEPVS